LSGRPLGLVSGKNTEFAVIETHVSCHFRSNSCKRKKLGSTVVTDVRTGKLVIEVEERLQKAAELLSWR
jgi:hypothetical protein